MNKEELCSCEAEFEKASREFIHQIKITNSLLTLYKDALKKALLENDVRVVAANSEAAKAFADALVDLAELTKRTTGIAIEEATKEVGQ